MHIARNVIYNCAICENGVVKHVASQYLKPVAFKKQHTKGVYAPYVKTFEIKAEAYKFMYQISGIVCETNRYTSAYLFDTWTYCVKFTRNHI